MHWNVEFRDGDITGILAYEIYKPKQTKETVKVVPKIPNFVSLIFKNISTAKSKVCPLVEVK